MSWRTPVVRMCGALLMLTGSLAMLGAGVGTAGGTAGAVVMLVGSIMFGWASRRPRPPVKR